MHYYNLNQLKRLNWIFQKRVFNCPIYHAIFLLNQKGECNYD